MVIELSFNKKNQIILFWTKFTFFNNKIIYLCTLLKEIMNKFSIFSFGQIINKIQLIIFEILCNV
jgi:hypothetical protein